MSNLRLWDALMEDGARFKDTGSFAEAHHSFTDALAVARRESNRIRVAKALYSLADLAMHFLPPDEPVEPAVRRLSLARESLSIFEEEHDLAGVSDCLRVVACVAIFVDSEEIDAISLLKESISICERIGYLRGIAMGWRALGSVSFAMGVQDEYRSAAREAIASARLLNDARVLADTLNSVAISRESPCEREALFHEAQTIYLELGRLQDYEKSLAMMNGLNQSD